MGACCGCCVDPEDRVLAGCTEKNTPRFLPQVSRAKVLSVYDGDTLTVAARHARRGRAYLFRVRLAGVDTPELRGSSADEKQRALLARDALRDKVQGKMVSVLPTGEQEKYGRLLARIEYQGKDICNWLIEN
ncbi:MAG: hypothetical protein SGPRY_012938, partial [Prymnesium sp.]